MRQKATVELRSIDVNSTFTSCCHYHFQPELGTHYGEVFFRVDSIYPLDSVLFFDACPGRNRPQRTRKRNGKGFGSLLRKTNKTSKPVPTLSERVAEHEFWRLLVFGND
jgi:hypothetical protein